MNRDENEIAGDTQKPIFVETDTFTLMLFI